jgi:uncharacterized protein (AIM24 family)
VTVQVRARHTPSFGVARIVLAPGETVTARLDAMQATSYGVGVTAKGRRHAQQAVFTAPAEGGWVNLAPPAPGDIHPLELDGATGWCVATSAVLAVAATVQLDQAWTGFHALFGGDTAFLSRATGFGCAVLAACGALDVITLAAGELVTVDPGHLVAYPESVQCRLRAISQSVPQSMRTGQGLALDFAGPGQVLTQTRNARGMANWLSANGFSVKS